MGHFVIANKSIGARYEQAKKIAGPIFAVHNTADHTNEENLGLDKLLLELEKHAEEAARSDQAAAALQAPSEQGGRNGARAETEGSSTARAASTTNSSTRRERSTKEAQTSKNEGTFRKNIATNAGRPTWAEFATAGNSHRRSSPMHHRR